jgi:hypothetical protein
MTTHLTKIWWDLNKHKLVEQAIPEAEIYKREWVGLTDEEIKTLPQWFPSHESAAVMPLIRAFEAKLREKNT